MLGTRCAVSPDAENLHHCQERSGGKAGKAILLGESFGGTLALGIAQVAPRLSFNAFTALPPDADVICSTLRNTRSCSRASCSQTPRPPSRTPRSCS